MPLRPYIVACVSSLTALDALPWMKFSGGTSSGWQSAERSSKLRPQTRPWDDRSTNQGV